MKANLERLLLQSPRLLTGAYLDVLDTFPSPVCFLISSVAWKLPWSLKGLLYGICQPLSNQVFSFYQMFSVYQKCCWWWNGIISVKFSSAVFGVLSRFYCTVLVPTHSWPFGQPSAVEIQSCSDEVFTTWCMSLPSVQIVLYFECTVFLMLMGCESDLAWLFCASQQRSSFEILSGITSLTLRYVHSREITSVLHV